MWILGCYAGREAYRKQNRLENMDCTTGTQELLHAEHCHCEGNSTAKLVTYNLQKDPRLSCSQTHHSRSQIIRQIWTVYCRAITSPSRELLKPKPTAISLPLVWGPVLAIESTPLPLCKSLKFSSSNFLP